jgi:hypothetical protein
VAIDHSGCRNGKMDTPRPISLSGVRLPAA